MAEETNDSSTLGHNFVRAAVVEDIHQGKNNGQVVTRFPPEPNGYLHIGHAKSIVLNFGLAKEFEGRCHLRLDDTNPIAEKPEYVEAIKEDIRWFGYDWGAHLYHASDYFEQLYQFAVQLVEKGLAYVDDSSPEEIRKQRGTLTEPGTESACRERPIAENLKLLEQMRAGEFADGSMVLRAKIDMASPNINLRDPVIYRIRHAHHQQTGDRWSIYPLYDFAHGLSDMIEGVTHSICTLEFEDHRPLYDWFLDALETPNHPRQIEFSRLNLDYTVLSKRRLLELVNDGHVNGWDDPRMPTIKGMRRRGFTAQAIRRFCERIGVTKKDSVIEVGALEHAVREDLDQTAPRAMAVLRPLKVVITNYPQDQMEELHAHVHPKQPELGERSIPFSNVVYIEQDDFMEEPPKNYFRLKPGGQVRLRYAYVITCQEVIKDDNGQVVELRCTYDARTKGGVTPEGEKKVKGIIHWVSASHAVSAEVRLYDRLFNVPNPTGDKSRDYKEFINPNSLEIIPQAYLEPSLKDAAPGSPYQFERLGFFCVDTVDSHKVITGASTGLVFNRTVTLKDTWSKSQ